MIQNIWKIQQNKVWVYLYARFLRMFPENIYLFKVSNRNVRKIYEICSRLSIKTPELRQWRLVSLLLTLNIFLTFSFVCTVDCEQLNVCWIHFHIVYLLSCNWLVTKYSKLKHRGATSEGRKMWGFFSALPFLQFEKKFPDFGRDALIWLIYGLNFSFKMLF